MLAEARWLGEQGVRELFLVSENSTSYGKDLGDLGLLEKLLPELSAVEGVERVRVSYLQPAEVRPGLLEAMATPRASCRGTTCPSSTPRPPCCAGCGASAAPRPSSTSSTGSGRREPLAGVRSNVIVGFPGETEADVDELERFLTQARLDVVGVFGYSDEDGTEAEELDGKLPDDVVAERVERLTGLIEELTTQRALERVGERVAVLVEEHDDEDPAVAVGSRRAPGSRTSTACASCGPVGASGPAGGAFVEAVVVDAVGVDLVVEAG